MDTVLNVKSNYSLLSSLLKIDDIIVVKKGESGYYKTNISSNDREEIQRLADEYNDKLGVTKAQAEAMVSGSMFGWHVPAADPKNYDKDGKLIPVKHRDRGDSR